MLFVEILKCAHNVRFVQNVFKNTCQSMYFCSHIMQMIVSIVYKAQYIGTKISKPKTGCYREILWDLVISWHELGGMQRNLREICLAEFPALMASIALMFSLICARINGWVNNRETGDLRRHHAHYDVIVMYNRHLVFWWPDTVGNNDIYGIGSLRVKS